MQALRSGRKWKWCKIGPLYCSCGWHWKTKSTEAIESERDLATLLLPQHNKVAVVGAGYNWNCLLKSKAIIVQFVNVTFHISYLCPSFQENLECRPRYYRVIRGKWQKVLVYCTGQEASLCLLSCGKSLLMLTNIGYIIYIFIVWQQN